MAKPPKQIAGFGTSGRRDREHMLEQAQDLIYKAWETPNRKRRIALAERALGISPDCADAYALLAEEADRLDAALELYQKGVEAGERALGKKIFAEEVGYFWGLLETRPYMRARAGLASCQWEKGQHDEALRHYRDLLRLNPNDNQGIRHVLALCLIQLRYHEELAALIERYKEDGSAEIVWTKALLSFRMQGDTAESRRCLSTARELNPHIAAYLCGLKKIPARLPDFISLGDENEASSYTAGHLEVWKATTGALAWLAGSLDTESP